MKKPPSFFSPERIFIIIFYLFSALIVIIEIPKSIIQPAGTFLYISWLFLFIVIGCLGGQKRKLSFTVGHTIAANVLYSAMVGLKEGWIGYAHVSCCMTLTPAVIAHGLSLLFRRPIRQIKTSNCCDSCGYNLTGNISGRCPECGFIYSRRKFKKNRHRWDTKRK